MKKIIGLMMAFFAFAANADTVLQTWKGDGLSAWTKRTSQIRGAKVSGGVLALETAGSDSQIYAPVLKPFLPKANQFVYVRARVPVAGRGQVFWMTDAESHPSGKRRVDFTFRPGEWRTYRLRPLWGGTNMITSLRMDFPNTMPVGARAEVSEVRISEEGEELAVDTALHGGVSFTLATSKAEYASLIWTTDLRPGFSSYRFYTVPDGRPHTYWFDLRDARPDNRGPIWTWRGKVKAFYVADRHTEEVFTLENLQFVSGRPEIPADPVITSAMPEEAIPRAGRPLALEVVVRNLGTAPARRMRFSVDGLPDGVKVLDERDLAPFGELRGTNGRHTLRADCGPALPNEARYRIALSDPGPGKFKLRVSLSAEGASAAPVDVPVEVLPSLGLPKAVYPPEPRPVDTAPYEIGAFIFPGWLSHKWHAVWTHAPWRKPVLGWYDESDPEVIDWQIKHLVENGVSFLYVDWYWKHGLNPNDHWSKVFAKARYRKYMKWALMWCNHTGKGTHSLKDQEEVTRYWIDNLFSMPEYMRHNGMPVVAIYDPKLMDADIGPGGCRRLLETSRDIARAAGHKGIWFVAVRLPDGRADREFLGKYEEWGFDATCEYKYTGAGAPNRPGFLDGMMPYEWLVEDSLPHWKALRENSALPFLPSLSTAFDNRPWLGDLGWGMEGVTAERFRRICEAGKRFSDETGVRQLLMGPLDEWGEGSIAYPNAEHGFKMLEAVRDTFGRKPEGGWPVNYAPADVGLGPYPAPAAGFGDARRRFADPPKETRPQTWYHWTTTGVTDDCIVADLKAMAEAGFGAAHVFMPDQRRLRPDVQPFTKEWWERWRTTIREAKKNGMELGFHNCPGWSSSGGAWIKPEDSMKVLVCSATDVADLSRPVDLARPHVELGFYRDVGVFMFPCDGKVLPAKVTGDFDADFDSFRLGKKAISLPVAKGDVGGSVVFEYSEPISPTSLVTTWNESQFHLDLEISASFDGKNWRKIAEHRYRLYNCQRTPKVVRLAKCEPCRYFRVKAKPVQPPPWVKHCRRSLAGAEFTTLPLVGEIDEKNGAAKVFGYRAPDDPSSPGVPRASIVDVTRYMGAGGTLSVPAEATASLPPAKGWRILRIGYTTTGKCCAPAPRSLKGLECDKLSKRGLDAHWPHMPRKMAGAPGGKGVVTVAIIDSWEVGGQNWTEDFPDEFRKRRGYDMRPWLPAMAGYTVENDGDTARFLYDVELTISDLLNENYYGYFAELCHREGMKSATESYYIQSDFMDSFAAADIPIGTWLLGLASTTPRIASSAGHLNGRRQIGAEAFTSDEKGGRWQVTPHELRVNGDRAWLEGLSQIVCHSYVQQPLDHVRPGYSLGRHGSHLNRHMTWWPEMKWWAKYVQRGQFILQSGEPKSDVLVFSGEGTPNSYPYQKALSAQGYGYDFCGVSDLRRLAVRDGGVFVPGRLPYEVLWLGTERYLSCATLRKIRTLADAGARIAGTRPAGTPTLADDQAEWNALVDDIWHGRRANVRTARSSLGAARAFGLRSPVESGGALEALRRVLGGRDFYFVMNLKCEPFEGNVSFAGMGRPERWDAKSGRIEPLPWLAGENGRVKVRLRLMPNESVFVSFREPMSGEGPQEWRKDDGAGDAVMDISTGWTVTSFIGKNAPSAPLAFPTLYGWNTSSDDRLKYFSGRATYERRVDLSSVRGGCALDLGDVREIANVWIDGEFIACLWEAPYRVELPPSLLAGRRGAVVRVEVVNTWPNRMIGDAIARANGAAETKGLAGVPQWVLDDRPDSGTGVYTWSNWLDGWKATDEPRPAGLLGPVRLLVRRTARGR